MATKSVIHKQPSSDFAPNNLSKMQRRRRNPAQKIAYAVPKHKSLPHVVKFSGGRSSGMLLFTLLDNGLLNAARGDVIVFNNTSAEHPATYEFVRKCKIACEEKGIPFFWTEFQTFEDASSAGIYNRLPAYRLVNDQPFSKDNPNGYHSRGEVFEELVSWSGFLPNQFGKRICTSWMKLFVSNEFLLDWFACKESIARLGHYGKESEISPESIYAAHLKNGGGTPKDIFLKKKQFCWSRPLHRPEQRFADFSHIADYTKINNPTLADKDLGGRVSFSGDFAIDYCSFVGFRADEPQRIAKMRARQKESINGTFDGAESDYYLRTPEGEHVYAPLVQMGKSKSDVLAFWNRRDWNLGLPEDANLSNCVYCFLKGPNALWQLAHRQDTDNRKLPSAIRGRANTPADINWWTSLEEDYCRDLVAEKREIKNKDLTLNGEKPMIGFFGIGKTSYRNIEELSKKFKGHKFRGKQRDIYLSEFQNLPCDCTD